MEQKMYNTVIQLQNQQQLEFHRLISHTKLGFNAVFRTCQLPYQYFDINAFSKSLLQINNLRSHFQSILTQYNKLNNTRLLSPIIQRIEQKDMIYIVSKAEEYSLRELVSMRQGLTEYEVVYFIMQLFEILTYCKSRNVFFQKIQLANIYLAQGMKTYITFSIFLNLPSNSTLMSRLTFRNQAKNPNNCPDLTLSKASNQLQKHKNTTNKTSQNQEISNNFAKESQQVNISMVNSWIMGVLIYEMLQNKKPFPNTISNFQHQSQELSKVYSLKFQQISSVESKDLITKLLQSDIKKRLNFPLIIIQTFIKNMKIIPYMLPDTVTMCPPSEEFKNNVIQKFARQKKLQQQEIEGNNQQKPQQEIIINHRSLKKRNQIPRTQIITKSVSNSHLFIMGQESSFGRRQSLHNKSLKKSPQVSFPQTQKYIKASQRSLTQNKIYIEQFVDISQVYGYGYQMNTGTLCFVFNDGTQFYFPNFTRKFLVYATQKGPAITYTYDKLPEQQELKKKIFILQAYSKSIKKYKNPTQIQSLSQNQKPIIVQRYAKTKHAAIFELSNNSIQLFFNDKISFLMTVANLYIMGKNNDKYERYDYKNETNEMKTRRDYLMEMSRKIFGWKKEKNLSDSEEEDQKIEGNNKKALIRRKNSLALELEAQEEMRDERLQSLKKMKEKQERNYRLFKKGAASQERIGFNVDKEGYKDKKSQSKFNFPI